MSMLDLKQPKLCEDIWDESGELNSDVTSFIIESLRKFFKVHDVEGYLSYIADVVIGSSLATYYYKADTDFDVKVILDVEALFKDLSITGVDSDTFVLSLTKLGRNDPYLTANVPGTQHALDIYFYDSEEFYPIDFNKYDSLYSLGTSSWIAPPRDIDFSSDPQAILKIAKEKATPYLDALARDIENAKRDVIDLIFFREYLKNLDNDEIKSVYSYFMDQFNETNASIEELIKDRQELKAMRTEAFSKNSLESELEKVMKSFNYSDENLVFKMVQRYGYMKLLYEVEEKFEIDGVSAENVDDYLDLLVKNL